MATRKGSALALMLYRMGGGKPWDTEEACSRIMRAAATFTRLQEEACSGPRWSWNYRGDWTRVISVTEWEKKNAAAIDRCGARIVAAVADLPSTEYGPILAELGGDPRGYTVRLLVPTAPGEVTEVGCDENGHQSGSRRTVTA